MDDLQSRTDFAMHNMADVNKQVRAALQTPGAASMLLVFAWALLLSVGWFKECCEAWGLHAPPRTNRLRDAWWFPEQVEAMLKSKEGRKQICLIITLIGALMLVTSLIFFLP